MDKLEITTTVSTKEWKPNGILSKLKQALKDGLGGAKEAIMEAYALVTGSVDSELDNEQVFWLHHEITDDGKVVLNKFALAKAAADLEQNTTLTDDQKEMARTHLLKHYRQLEEEPPASLTGEMVRLTAKVCGEMAVEDIPVAPVVDLAALKEGDEDPLEVVVEIPAAKSRRGWNYLPRSIQDIVAVVAAEGLPGYAGHQKEDALDWEFRLPVTHWVGAVWKDGKGYFRGVVDKAADDLKRWIKSGVIKTVSIWGIPKLAFEGGETKVIGYNPISIDWTPPRRAGMPTRIVAMGEMDSTFGEMDGSYEELRKAIQDEVRGKFGVGPNKNVWVYIEKTFDNYVIALVETDKPKFFKIDYALDGDKVILGEPVEVEKQEIFMPKEQKGSGEMTIQEMLAAIRSAIAKNEVNLQTVFGEMGVTKEAVVEQFAGEEMAKLKKAAEYGAKLAETLGFTADLNTEQALAVAGEMAGVWQALGYDKEKPEKPAEVVGEMVSTQATLLKEAHDALVSETIREKVAGEQAQLLVKKLLNVEVGATKEQVVGEIDNILKDEAVKGILGKNFVEPPVAPGGEGGTAPKNLIPKTVEL